MLLKCLSGEVKNKTFTGQIQESFSFTFTPDQSWCQNSLLQVGQLISNFQSQPTFNYPAQRRAVPNMLSKGVQASELNSRDLEHKALPSTPQECSSYLLDGSSSSSTKMESLSLAQTGTWVTVAIPCTFPWSMNSFKGVAVTQLMLLTQVAPAVGASSLRLNGQNQPEVCKPRVNSVVCHNFTCIW